MRGLETDQGILGPMIDFEINFMAKGNTDRQMEIDTNKLIRPRELSQCNLY